MHKRIVSFIKYNKFFLWGYRLGGNALIAIFKLFLKRNPKKILFMSFGGQKYDDSPKALYEAMTQDPFFADYEFVWAFCSPENHPGVSCRKVKVDTLDFLKTALSAGVWINNSSVNRGLSLKQKETFELNTWHGTPLKKMGRDVAVNLSYSHKSKQRVETTIYCSQSGYDQEIFTRLFDTDKEHILISDLPRNDSLLKYEKPDLDAIRKQLCIPEGKKVILYAPTFREYDRTGFNSCYINPPINLEKWKSALGNDYVLLFRAHYEIVSVLGIRNDGFCFDVSSYPYLNDLIAVSDLLISDYSSIYFDYSITEKPMLNFSYDLKTYTEKRGLYLDLNDVLPCDINFTEDTLISEIKTLDEETYRTRTRVFKSRFCPNAGNAVNTVIGVLKKRLSLMKEGKGAV